MAIALTPNFVPENDSPSKVVDWADAPEAMEPTAEELSKGDDATGDETNQGTN